SAARSGAWLRPMTRSCQPPTCRGFEAPSRVRGRGGGKKALFPLLRLPLRLLYHPIVGKRFFRTEPVMKEILRAFPRVMGIVNINDDSFSGDGTLDVGRALARALEMVRHGADIID